jgi:subtilase family serine protease
MILTLRIPAEAQVRLEALLTHLQDPASPLYHHWLTPEAFGAQFGPAQQDLDQVLGWLEQHELQVEAVTAGRTAILFSGNVQKVEHAFQTLILDYRLEGRVFRANATDPSIPRALADLVHGVVSMHNLPRKAMHHGLRPVLPEGPGSEYTTGSGAHYLAPGDFAAIYNAKPLYAAGTNGSGVTIAIVGRTHIAAADVATFRSQFGLPANAPVFVLNGADPGDLGADEDCEADLDVEWAGAVAPNATIKFVMSKSTTTTDGVDLSALYIVNNNLAAVMSTSFGQCEANMGTSENNFYNNLWAQAAAQGITSFVAAGDSGVAGCYGGSSASASGQGVSGLASTPYNVCVGGTEFSDGGGNYWATANGTGQASATGYIPEVAWNESGTVAGGSGLWATGGGVSSLYAKPSWQAAPGVPGDGRRDVPDVSLAAAGHDGYLIQTQGRLGSVGGTSASSPAFAGLMALVVQATGQRQGNANLVFYKLGNAQYRGTGAKVFHDIVAGNNSVPGSVGYACGTGYDLATGLGSVDAQALVGYWAGGAANTLTATIATPAASLTVASGAVTAFAGTAKDSATAATLAYSWNFGDGTDATGATASHAFTNTGTANASCTVTLTVKDSTGIVATATRAITVTPAPRNTLTATIATPAANLTVASGAVTAFAGTAKDSSSTAILSYSWNFGDGGTAAGATASHAFTNTGTTNASYTVTLTVKDSTGIVATATRAITVTPAPTALTATISTPTANVTVASGSTVYLTGVATDTTAGAVLNCSWSATPNATATPRLQPMATATTLTSGCSVYLSNTGPSPYSVTVTFLVADNKGARASASRILTVTPAGR